jgi:hypothetical protein
MRRDTHDNLQMPLTFLQIHLFSGHVHLAPACTSVRMRVRSIAGVNDKQLYETANMLLDIAASSARRCVWRGGGRNILWNWQFLTGQQHARAIANSPPTLLALSSQIVSQFVGVCSCVQECVCACVCACVGLRTCLRIPCLLCGSQLLCLRPSIL